MERALCERLIPRIRAYGLLHLRDEDAASDLVQHVLVVVIEALRHGKLTDPEGLVSFVLGTCRNTVKNWRTVARRRVALLQPLVDGAEPSVEAGMEEAVARGAELVRLEECMRRLSARETALVTLTFFRELSGAELGEELEMKPGAVRVARHRALKQLLACLEARP